jgi:prevent-host-death family protein
MKQVGVYDAKTHLPKLLDEVERGETVTITRHGRPVAKLVPVSGRQRTVEEAIEAIREFGRSHPRGDLNIKELIEEGRR